MKTLLNTLCLAFLFLSFVGCGEDSATLVSPTADFYEKGRLAEEKGEVPGSVTPKTPQSQASGPSSGAL